MSLVNSGATEGSVVADQQREAVRAICALVGASRKNTYTVQAMGKEWPVVTRFEVIHVTTGEIDAEVKVSPAGVVSIVSLLPALDVDAPSAVDEDA
jgi:hypothetical protein